MKLALVSPLPPLGSPAAELVAELVPHLRAAAEVRLLPLAPAQVDAGWTADFTVDPCADLPHLLATGAVDLPVYFVADDLLHAHQVRFIREFPGLLILLTKGVHRIVAALTEESGDLEGYRELLVEEHGEAARGWPERFLWRVDRDRLRDRLPLAGVLCRRSLAVLAPAAIAAGLQRRDFGVSIAAFGSADAAESIAMQIIEQAQAVIAEPRSIPDLSAPNWPDVEALVVSYNSRRIIGPALQSILDQDYPNLSCTVVDNASTDGTAEFIRDEFPGVNLEASESNRGFAGGNNFALRRSAAKYVVLLNQDAVARRDFVRELVRVAERDDKIAAVGAKMLMMRCPTILNSTGVIMNEGGFAVDRGIGEKDVDPSPIPDRVFAVSGGAKLVRTEWVREFGGFDEAFFMYFEDVDLCWHMRLTGYEVLFAPLAVVHHDWHGDLDGDLDGDPEPVSAAAVNAKAARRRLMCERNRIQSVMKNLPARVLFRTLLRLRRYDRARCRSMADAIRDGINVNAATIAKRAIESANRWCFWHAPSILSRRFQGRGSRRVPDEEVMAYFENGVEEPHHVGDVSVINDRHSAESSARLQMGVSDGRALGPGWHNLEPVAGAEYGARWSKGRAWLYIDAGVVTTRLCVRVARGPVETGLSVKLGAHELGSLRVEGGELQVLQFELPESQSVVSAIEVEFRCLSFRPSEISASDDRRELGVRVAEVWLE